MGYAGIPIRVAEILSRFDSGPVIGVEVGVFRGNMSVELLAKHPNLFLYMVDSWADSAAQPEPYKQIGDYHAKLSGADQMANKRAAFDDTEQWAERRSILYMTSIDAAKRFQEHFFDFVFIDADHSYEGCRSDIEAWKSKIRPGGYLSGHDYGHENLPLFGVKRAVDEAVQQNGWALELGQNYTWFVRL